MFRKEGLVTILFPLCSLQSGGKRFCFRGGNIHFFMKIFVTLFLWPHHMACEVEFPLPGTERVPPALGAWNLNHWASREVPMKICRAMRKLCTHSGHSIHQPFPSVLLEGQSRTRVIIRKMYWDVWPVTICVYKILWSCVNLWVGLQTPSSEAHLPPEKALPTRERPECEGYVILGSPGTRCD